MSLQNIFNNLEQGTGDKIIYVHMEVKCKTWKIRLLLLWTVICKCHVGLTPKYSSHSFTHTWKRISIWSLVSPIKRIKCLPFEKKESLIVYVWLRQLTSSNVSYEYFINGKFPLSNKRKNPISFDANQKNLFCLSEIPMVRAIK